MTKKTGEFDEDYIQQLKEMAAPKEDTEPLTTTDDYEPVDQWNVDTIALAKSRGFFIVMG